MIVQVYIFLIVYILLNRNSIFDLIALENERNINFCFDGSIIFVKDSMPPAVIFKVIEKSATYFMDVLNEVISLCNTEILITSMMLMDTERKLCDIFPSSLGLYRTNGGIGRFHRKTVQHLVLLFVLCSTHVRSLRDVHVITVANQINPALCTLLRSTINNGYIVHLTGLDITRGNTLINFQEKKPKAVLDILKNSPSIQDNDLVVFADGFDVIAQMSVTQLLQKYDKLGKPNILFSGETYCFPWNIHNSVSNYCRTIMKEISLGSGIICNPKIRSWYWVDKSLCVLNITSSGQEISFDPNKNITFPFINVGLYITKKSYLVKLLDKYIISYQNIPWLHGSSDQGIIQDIYATSFEGFGNVDIYAEMFLNMCCPRLPTKFVTINDYGLIQISVNNSTKIPAFVHWPGFGSSAATNVNYLALQKLNKHWDKRNSHNLHAYKHGVDIGKDLVVQQCNAIV